MGCQITCTGAPGALLSWLRRLYKAFGWARRDVTRCLPALSAKRSFTWWTSNESQSALRPPSYEPVGLWVGPNPKGRCDSQRLPSLPTRCAVPVTRPRRRLAWHRASPGRGPAPKARQAPRPARPGPGSSGKQHRSFVDAQSFGPQTCGAGKNRLVVQCSSFPRLAQPNQRIVVAAWNQIF